MGSKNGTNAEKMAIRAEALVHRADAYLALVNVYGKPYNAATATTDQGVPLLTTPALKDLYLVPPWKEYMSILFKT